VLCKHEAVGSIPSSSTSFGGQKTEYGRRKSGSDIPMKYKV